MCGVLRIDFLKFYRSISGITGHPSENQKHLVLEFFIVCWMQKSVCAYLVPFSNESVKTSAGCSKKKLPRLHIAKKRLLMSGMVFQENDFSQVAWAPLRKAI